MGLPRVAAYPLPRADELPERRVGWQLDPSRAALLIHDMQRYFLRIFPGDAAPLPGVVANIAALRTRCAEAGVPVFYTVQHGAQNPLDRGLQADFWGPGMPPGEEHVGIEPAVEPGPGDLVLPKWRYSAFQRTTLEEMMRVRGRDQLVVTGVYAHIGCLLTSADAFMRDIHPFLVADAVADFSREHHDRAMTYVAGHCGVVASTAEILEAF